MRIIRFGLFVFMLLIMNASYSEELITEEWAGKVIMPGTDEKEHVSYQVKVHVHKITMIYNSDPYEFENLIIEGDNITFDLDTGTLYKCNLEKKNDKSYSGDCINKDPENNEKRINISMTPHE